MSTVQNGRTLYKETKVKQHHIFSDILFGKLQKRNMRVMEIEYLVF